MADPAKSVSQLAAEIEAKSRPRLAKCDPSEPRRSQCEDGAMVVMVALRLNGGARG